MSKTYSEDFIAISIIFMHCQTFSFAQQTSRIRAISCEMYIVSAQITQDPVRDSKILVLSHFLRAKILESLHFECLQKIFIGRTTMLSVCKVNYKVKAVERTQFHVNWTITASSNLVGPKDKKFPLKSRPPLSDDQTFLGAKQPQ